VVDVIEKSVEGAGALIDAAQKFAPFTSAKDARNEIEWYQPLVIAAFAIDGEIDAQAPEQGYGFGLATPQHVFAGGVHRPFDRLVGLADTTLGAAHFIDHFQQEYSMLGRSEIALAWRGAEFRDCTKIRRRIGAFGQAAGKRAAPMWAAGGRLIVSCKQ
jgi:hypothetical protein